MDSVNDKCKLAKLHPGWHQPHFDTHLNCVTLEFNVIKLFHFPTADFTALMSCHLES